MNSVCRCNQCDSLLWDEKPKPSTPEIVGELPFTIPNMAYNNGHVCPNCMTDKYLTDLSPDEMLPNAYYRLQNIQTGGYLASSCNALGLKQWAKEFLDYYTSDLLEGDAQEYYKLSPEEVIEVAYEAGFWLQMSQYPFETEKITQIALNLVEKMWPTCTEQIAVQLTNDVVWFTYSEIEVKDNKLVAPFYSS